MTKALYALVGMKHRGTEALVASLLAGEPLTLFREPANPYDPNAIQVWAKGRHVGFIKASQARDLARRMDIALEKERRAPNLDLLSTNGKLAIDGGKWPMVEVEE